MPTITTKISEAYIMWRTCSHLPGSHDSQTSTLDGKKLKSTKMKWPLLPVSWISVRIDPRLLV